MRLEGRVAVVTGAARGIGKAIASCFAEEGADVVIPDVDLENVNATAQEITKRTNRRVVGIKTDVSDPSDVDEMAKTVIDKFGKADILVNNAGIPLVRRSEDMTADEWDKVMDINLKGVFLCSKAFGRHMIERRAGRIINIASMDAIVALPERAAYCASKAGVMQLSKVLAVEWAKYNVRVNAIAPGYTKTDIVKGLIERGLFNEEDIKRRSPMHRMADPSEIAKVALFLASDESSYVTGETILVDGGWTAYGYI